MTYRYKSMDTLRACAIILVLLAHSVLAYGAPTYLAPLQLGGTGVDLFFVLSGWLLGNQLFKESVNGQINIKKFWYRRWMRTLPAYYFVLLLSILQRYLTKENIEFPFSYFFFIQNYDSHLEFFYISWSLCVEEQFYLIIAPLIALITKLDKKSSLSLLILILIIPSIFRYLDFYSNLEQTHVRFDGCIAGVLMAHIYRRNQDIWGAITNKIGIICIFSLTAYLAFYIGRYIPTLSMHEPGKLLLAVIFSTWVIAANKNEKWSNRIYFPGAQHIATRSYALYLLHPEILALLKRMNFSELPFIIYFIATVVGSLALAEILYQKIEKPFMLAREKFNASKENITRSSINET